MLRVRVRVTCVLASGLAIAASARGQVDPPRPNCYPNSQPYEPRNGCLDDSKTSDPINLALGDFHHAHTDVSIPGRLTSLEFTRTYRHRSGFWSVFFKDEPNGAGRIDDWMARNQPLGMNWDHSLNVRVHVPNCDWIMREGCPPNGGIERPWCPRYLNYFPGDGRKDRFEIYEGPNRESGYVYYWRAEYTGLLRYHVATSVVEYVDADGSVQSFNPLLRVDAFEVPEEDIYRCPLPPCVCRVTYPSSCDSGPLPICEQVEYETCTDDERDPLCTPVHDYWDYDDGVTVDPVGPWQDYEGGITPANPRSGCITVQVLTADAGGKIASFTDRGGNEKTWVWEAPVLTGSPCDPPESGDWRIASVTDELGNTLSFTYRASCTYRDACLIDTVTHDQTGRVWRFEYLDEYPNDTTKGYDKRKLTAVRLPEVTTTPDYPLPVEHARFPDPQPTTVRAWRYEYDSDPYNATTNQNTKHPAMGQMVKLYDPNGTLITRNVYTDITLDGKKVDGYPRIWTRYAAQNRVILQEHNGHTYNYAVTGRGLPVNSPEIEAFHEFTVWINDRTGTLVRHDYHPVQIGATPQFYRATPVVPVLYYEYTYDEKAPSSSSPTWGNETWGTAYASNMTNGPGGAQSISPQDAIERVVGYQAIDPSPASFDWKGDLRRSVERWGSLDDGPGTTTYEWAEPAFKTSDPRESGRLLSMTRGGTGSVPAGFASSGPVVTEEWSYQYDLTGSCGCGSGGDFATGHKDANGNVTLREFDTQGNLLKVYRGLPANMLDYDPANATDAAAAAAAALSVESFTYNAFGQMTSHTHPPKRLVTGTLHTRVDQYVYDENATSVNFGRLVSMTVDAGGEDLVTTYSYNAAGDRVLAVDPSGDATTWLYNQDGDLVREQQWNGAVGTAVMAQTDLFYDAAGRLVRQETSNRDELYAVDPSNASWTTLMEYDDIGNVVAEAREIEDDNGTILEIPGSRAVDLVAFVNQAGWTVSRYTYDGNSNLTLAEHGEAVDGRQLSNRTKYEYDTFDRLTVRRDGYVSDTNSLRVTTYTHDPVYPVTTSVKVTATAEPDRVWNYLYDGLFRRVQTTDPMGNVGKATYDPNGNVLAHTSIGQTDDVAGQVNNRPLSYRESAFDAMDRMIVSREYIFDPAAGAGFMVPSTPDGNNALPRAVTTTVYNADSSTRTMTEPTSGAAGLGANAGVTQYFYDTVGRLARVEDAVGNMLDQEYDDDGNVVETVRTDRRAGPADEVFVTQMDYDALDRVVRERRGVTAALPLGHEDSFWYDSRGNLVAKVDSNNHLVEYEHDGLNRAVLERRVMGGTLNPEITTTINYDDSSRVTSFVDDNNEESFFTYDGLDRVLTHTLPDTAVYTWQYDGFGDVVGWSDPRGTMVEQDHDQNGRVVERSGTPGAGVIGVVDETFAYDGLGRLRLAQNEAAKVTRKYDSRGLLLEERQNHDAPGFAVNSDRIVTCEFDLAGNERRTVYPGGREVWRVFDELNRLASIDSDAAGTQNILDYTYAGPGRVATRTAGNGVLTTYRYNGFSGATAHPDHNPADQGVGRVAGVTHTLGAANIAKHVLRWDSVGNKTADLDLTSAFSSRRTRTFGYDADNRLVSTDFDYPGTTPSLVAGTDYVLDGLHNRTSVTGDDDAGALIGTYLPDELNQYAEVPGLEYEYDANGNLVQFNEPCGADFTGDWTIDSGDLSAFVTALSTNDPLADLTGDGQFDSGDLALFVTLFTAGMNNPNCLHAHFDYDYKNRLRSFAISRSSDELASGLYTYDALSRRVSKDADTDGDGVADDVAYFIYAGQAAWQVIEEWDGPGAPTNATRTHDYVYGNYIDELVHSRDLTGAQPIEHYAHQDDLFSVVAVTDSTGAVVERYQYGDYGDRRIFDAAGNTREYSLIGLRHGFTGQLHDDESGLVLMRHRHLNPKDGKWLQRDPAWYVDGASISAYVTTSPHRFLDPLGLDVWVENTTSVYGFHQRICVDVWNADCTQKTGKFCISFGLDRAAGHTGNGSTSRSASEDGGSSDSDSSGDSSTSGDEPSQPGVLPPGTHFPIDGPDPKGDGIVYQDMKDPCVKIAKHTKSTCERDKATLTYLNSLVGVKANYSLCGQNCRDFSSGAYDYVVDHIINESRPVP
jgi:RHS repeat-associated protein